eukprot:CAMPEP_0117442772 /NCGR_PEP_ID=MMETSP0759-20121206/4333_1 /TAXON_ID=63605 /ORGANISM="Percolomonas cosmopolitus, Strain WS" /LENGTH=679 /DNA_ID=CAMNT_0005234689 /DNA_START=321 /DNA_END=2357 /DNA_ORIENTATION=-
MTTGIAIYQFDAEYPGELSVQENQVITILEQHDDGWSMVKLASADAEDLPDDEREGLVPSSYLKVLKMERRLPPRPPRKNSSIRSSMVLSSLTGGTESADGTPITPLSSVSPMSGLSTSGISSTQHEYPSFDVTQMEKLVVAHLRRQKWRKYWSQEPSLKKRRTRISLIKETLSTEETYVQNLKLCLKVFGSLKGSELLFKGLSEVIEINEELLTKLRKEARNLPVAYIGRVFKEICPKMTIYTEVINNYDKAFEMYQQWLTTNKRPFVSQLNKIYKKHEAELRGNLLESFLILPVQRIPRYRMLLESILKYTPDDHVERQDIEDALEDVKQLAQYIDDQKKLIEHSEVKNNLTQIINEYSVHKGIAHNNRRLIRDGTLTVTCTERGMSGIKFKCYLLNDLLVLTDALDGVASNRGKRNYRVEFFFMCVTKLVEETDSSFSLRTFHLKEKIQIQFSSGIPAECPSWCKALKSAIATCKALYSRYELEDDLIKLATDRCTLQDASKESMSQYTQLRMEAMKQTKMCSDLQKKIRQHQEEMRRLQQMIEEQRQVLEEYSRESSSTQEKCDFYKKRVFDCLEGVKARDKIFSGLLRHESDAFQVIFADSPTNDPSLANGTDSEDAPGVGAGGSGNGGSSSPLDNTPTNASGNGGRRLTPGGKLRSPSILLNIRRTPPPAVAG